MDRQVHIALVSSSVFDIRPRVLGLHGIGKVKVVEEGLLLDGEDGVRVDGDDDGEANAGHAKVAATKLDVTLRALGVRLLSLKRKANLRSCGAETEHGRKRDFSYLLHKVHLDGAELLRHARIVDLDLRHLLLLAPEVDGAARKGPRASLRATGLPEGRQGQPVGVDESHDGFIAGS